MLTIPTLFLICGLPGSGKTTIAMQLEQTRSALRLTPDEWMSSLAIDLYDQPKRTAVEALQWKVAERALTLRLDVILDFGFWSRQERDEYRSRAKALGARAELCFLDVSLNELWARISYRNAHLPPAPAHIEKASLDLWWTWFERPAAEEFEMPSGY